MQHMLALQNGTPLAILQHLKKMQPSAASTQMRISSGGTVLAANSPSQPLQPQSSSNTASPIVHQSPPVPVPQHAGLNGVGRPAISMPHVKVAKADAITAPTLPIVNSVSTSPQPEVNGDTAMTGTPVRPKSQNLGHIGIPSNGYHLPLTNMSAALLNSAYLPQNGQHAVGGLSLLQV
jgi:hypothetical protein